MNNINKIYESTVKCGELSEAPTSITSNTLRSSRSDSLTSLNLFHFHSRRSGASRWPKCLWYVVKVTSLRSSTVSVCTDYAREAKLDTAELAVQLHHFRGSGGHGGDLGVAGLLVGVVGFLENEGCKTTGKKVMITRVLGAPWHLHLVGNRTKDEHQVPELNKQLGRRRKDKEGNPWSVLVPGGAG